MKTTIFFLLAAALSLPTLAQKKKYAPIIPDTAKVRYVMSDKALERYIISPDNQRNIIYVNEEVTTHIVMPEDIKLVDLSTNKIVGNQSADNIVRIKPSGRMYDKELVGTVTILGERHIAQFNVVFTKGPAKAHAIYYINTDDMNPYVNPDVLMPRGDMAKFAWAMYMSKRQFNNIKAFSYGVRGVVNNIYTVDDYFFIDFSLYNKTKVKFDIDEIRIKLMDKKEAKATNSQTIELTPVFTLNNTKSFKKSYRNVLVLKKLTFPDEKILHIEVHEDQISGRAVFIKLDYDDILNADGFDESLMEYLPSSGSAL